jgi:hypothetical protein
VTRRQARYLAASVAVWGVGMYVDMTILPAFFVLPALWLVYRPPIRIKPLLAAMFLILVVWFPYLRFEAPRAFADVRSQVLFHPILPADYRDAWCNPNLRLRTATAHRPTAFAANRLHEALVTRSATSLPARGRRYASDRLLSNFRGIVPFRGNGVISVGLLLMVFITLLWLATSPTQSPSGRSGWLRRWRAPLAIAGIACGVAGYLLGRWAPGGPQLHLADLERPGKLLLAGGIVLLAATGLSCLAKRLFPLVGARLQNDERASQRRLLVLSLIIPWLIVVVMAETGKPERYLWLWPLQVILLAAFVTHVLPALRLPRPLTWAAQAALLFLLLGNHLLTSRVDAWSSTGWSGRNADEVRVVDYLAQRLKSEGKERAAIGYHVFIYPFMANYNIKNATYKVGSDFDVLLRYRHGIVNTDTCAEGFSARDDYRIIRTTPMKGVDAPRSYFDVHSESGFRLVRRFGPYRVLRRA